MKAISLFILFSLSISNLIAQDDAAQRKIRKSERNRKIDEIVKMMVGREIGDRYPQRSSVPGPVRFKVENLADTKTISGISIRS